MAFKLRESVQRVAIANAFAQFAIVPVVDARENRGAQGLRGGALRLVLLTIHFRKTGNRKGLRGGDAVAPGAGLLQAALQIQADLIQAYDVTLPMFDVKTHLNTVLPYGSIRYCAQNPF